MKPLANVEFDGRPPARLLYFGLCLYLLSQAYLIPLVAIGPSWTLWPTLTDLATVLLGLMLLLNWQELRLPSVLNQRTLVLLYILVAGCLLYYAGYLAFVNKEVGATNGGYAIFRLVQFVVVYWIVIHIPLDEPRIRTLRRIVDLTLIITCAGIALTYFGTIPLSQVVAHLPQGFESAGPWYRYTQLDRLGYEGIGWGFVSYNHAYVAIQPFTLLVLRMHLSGQKRSATHTLFLALVIVACFLTNSRTGFAGSVLFALLYWIRKPLGLALGVLFATSVVLALLVFMPSISSISAQTDTVMKSLQRQSTVVNLEESENLSGRTDIWLDRLTRAFGAPWRGWIGGGFGSARDSGSIAHNVYLHVFFETGIFGLLFMLFLFAHILFFLYRTESSPRPLFWGTAVLLFTSFTNDYFYPMPFNGHFIGLYLCAIGIALATPAAVVAEQEGARTQCLGNT